MKRRKFLISSGAWWAAGFATGAGFFAQLVRPARAGQAHPETKATEEQPKDEPKATSNAAANADSHAKAKARYVIPHESLAVLLLVADVILPRDWAVQDIGSDYVLAVVENDLDVERVMRFRLSGRD